MRNRREQNGNRNCQSGRPSTTSEPCYGAEAWHHGKACWSKAMSTHRSALLQTHIYTHTRPTVTMQVVRLLSRQTLTHSIIHPKSYGQLTHRQEDQLLPCINSWSIPQILMMFTVYCCVSTWLTTCFRNKLTESGYLRFRREMEWLRGRDWQDRDTKRETEWLWIQNMHCCLAIDPHPWKQKPQGPISCKTSMCIYNISTVPTGNHRGKLQSINAMGMYEMMTVLIKQTVIYVRVFLPSRSPPESGGSLHTGFAETLLLLLASGCGWGPCRERGQRQPAVSPDLTSEGCV